MTRTAAPLGSGSTPALRPIPATAKQRAFIEKLLAERDVSGTAYEGWQPDWSKATVTTASQVVEFLLARPKKSAPAAGPAFGAVWASIPVGGGGYGYYALQTGEESWKFYRVERPKSGPHAGKTFIKEQAGDTYYPVEPRARGYAAMNEIARDPETAGLAYAEQIGRCYRCGRTLTDPESRERGMGPDCYARA